MNQDTPKTELWGTFSVRDHVKQKAPFLVEVLLYDHLVVPRPPTPKEEPPGPGEQDQVARWTKAGWEPGLQRKILDAIKEEDENLVLELPWGKQARKDFGDVYDGDNNSEEVGAKRAALLEKCGVDVEHAKRVAGDQAPYVITGGLLQSYVEQAIQHKEFARMVALARTPGTTLDSVVAYNTFASFETEQAVQPAQPADPVQPLQPYVMLGWDFFLPEDTPDPDHKRLRKAVRFARDPDFRARRQSFHGWLRQMHEGGVAPAEARDQMLKMLAEYKAAVKDSGLATVVRYVAKAVHVTSPVLGAAAGAAVGYKYGSALGAVTGAVVKFASDQVSVVAEWLVPKKAADARVRPAAVIYDSKNFLEKK